jgi:hypothetical protein
MASEQKYVFYYVDPALEDGYLTWPLPTNRPTIVGVVDVPGNKLLLLLYVTFRFLNPV